MKILAIDYGTKRIGTAISQGSLAEPLAVFQNDQNIFNQLLTVIKEHNVERIIIGLSENEMAQKTRDFAQEMEQIIEIPYEFADETLTSQQVEERLQQKGVKKSTRQGPIDHFAAAMILEDWLEQQGI
jgi:putative Holliday junction resolvase